MAQLTVRNKTYTSTIRKRKMERTALSLMALPFIIYIFIFSYIPLVGWSLAFFHYKVGMDFLKMPFAGLSNFAALGFFKDDIGRALTNTLAMSFLGFLSSPLPVVFAIMISEVRHRWFSKITQSLSTLPNFLSYIIVFMMIFGVFSRDGAYYKLLMHIELIEQAPPITILGISNATWFFQTAIDIWKGLGWGAIIYLAAIAGIDQELYDAAEVDGADRFRKIWHITVPGVIETYLVLLLLGVSSMLGSNLERIVVFYNPLVANRIETLDYLLYRVGIKQNDISFTTAISILKTLISIVLLFSVNRISKKLRGYNIL